MEYKAIIFDLDGTAIKSRRDAMPTARVIEAVKKAKEKVIVCAATGRPISMVREIFEAFDLESPCVISGGTQIIDPKTGKIISEHSLLPEQVKKIIDTCKVYDCEMVFNDEENEMASKERQITGDERIIFVLAMDEDKANNLKLELEKIPDISVSKVESWINNGFDLHITHTNATKKHAIERLLTIIGVSKNEVIGVGDAENDLPLFESVGFKVAMGNAMENLKKAADFVAPSVDDDGLAAVIEKYIL